MNERMVKEYDPEDGNKMVEKIKDVDSETLIHLLKSALRIRNK